MSTDMAGGRKAPAITIVVVDSRSKIRPDYLEKCMSSIHDQYFNDIEVIVIDNIDRKHSIGEAYNLGLEQASSDWVYYLGDDDWVSKDYFASLVPFLYETKSEHEDMVAGSTYCIFTDDDLQKNQIRANAPMGAWYRPFFIENGIRFDETLKKHVDVDLLRRVHEIGKKMYIMTWHFGYFYRQHSDQVSGRKLIKED